MKVLQELVKTAAAARAINKIDFITRNGYAVSPPVQANIINPY